MLKEVSRTQVVGVCFAVGALAIVMAGSARAQSAVRYRNYELGGSVASVAALAGVKVSKKSTFRP